MNARRNTADLAKCEVRRQIPRDRADGWIRRAAMLLGVIVLAGCAATAEPREDFRVDRATKVFTAGFANIQDKYIEPVDIPELAFEGMENLDEIDPSLVVTKSRNSVNLSAGGVQIADLVLPETRTPRDWARFTARVVSSARRGSAALHAADSETIYEAVFRGALLPLDLHSRYVGMRSARDYRAQREGFGGIGVRLGFEGVLPVIEAILPETPAARSRLRAGDTITHVDGESLIGFSQREVIWRLRGLEGTTVNIRASRSDRINPITVALKRAQIFNRTVEYERRGDLALIRVTGFNQRTSRDLEQTVVGLPWNESPPIRGIVLDLRGNPGGLLDQAVAVADVFLGSGRIVSTRGRHPESVQRFNATGRDLAHGTPMVVLINGRSASAAEIVASALQDRGRAVVVGSNSYGKGTVQNITRLPNEGELILTWSRFHAPSGYTLDRLGVLPNVCAATLHMGGDPDLRGQMLTAIGEATIALARWRTFTSFDGVRRSGLRKICPSRTDKSKMDLAIAREILRDRRLYARTLGMSAPKLAKKKRADALTN